MKKHLSPSFLLIGCLCLFILCTFCFSATAGDRGMFTPARPYQENRAPIESQGKWGFIDKEGKVVVPPIWDDVGDYKNDFAKIISKDKIGYINQEGEVIIPPQWDLGSNFYQGYAKVGKSHVLYNQTYNDYREGYFFIDSQGHLLSPTIWGEASVFIDGLAMVQKNFKWGFINTKGHVVHPLQWDDIYPLTRQVLPRPNFQYIDDEEGLGPWEGRSLFLDGLIVVVKDGLSGLMNNHWEVVAPPAWEKIEALSEGLAVVIEPQTHLYGFIDTRGALIIPAQWEEATAFEKGRAKVKKGDQWHWIDTKGFLIEGPDEKALSPKK